jgi:hypothetical protein
LDTYDDNGNDVTPVPPSGELVTKSDLEQMWAGRMKALLKVIAGHPARCRDCGREIWWLVTAAGRKSPYTEEGISHFADCPAAQARRQR